MKLTVILGVQEGILDWVSQKLLGGAWKPHLNVHNHHSPG